MIQKRKKEKPISLLTPFYNPYKTFQENYDKGPWGNFKDGKSYKNKGEPTYSFLGHKIFFPFGISSGPLFNSNYIKAALDKGFDIVIQKTVRSQVRVANPFPNVVPLKVDGKLTIEDAQRGIPIAKSYSYPLTITNSFGNPSFLPDVWQPDLKKSLSYVKKGQVLACSIEGTGDGSGNIDQFIGDWVTTARLVKETGCPILEANTSCPNEGSTQLLCFDVQRTQKILYSIKNEIGNMPLIVKLAFFSDKKSLEALVKAIGKIADAISVINTIPTKVVKENGELAIEGRPVAGGCGDGVRWAGLEMVKDIARIKEKLGMKFEIIGMGGVFNATHYKQYRKAGANIVMSATGAIWNPYLSQDIKESQLKS